jgi:hypothetical protein
MSLLRVIKGCRDIWFNDTQTNDKNHNHAQLIFETWQYDTFHDDALKIDTCGLYYKRITIVIDTPSVVSKWHS